MKALVGNDSVQILAISNAIQHLNEQGVLAEGTMASIVGIKSVAADIKAIVYDRESRAIRSTFPDGLFFTEITASIDSGNGVKYLGMRASRDTRVDLLTNTQFVVTFRRDMILPVMPESICHWCGREADAYGEHTLKCKNALDATKAYGHNSWRFNAFFVTRRTSMESPSPCKLSRKLRTPDCHPGPPKRGPICYLPIIGVNELVLILPSRQCLFPRPIGITLPRTLRSTLTDCEGAKFKLILTLQTLMLARIIS